jgi:hypothetical protein
VRLEDADGVLALEEELALVYEFMASFRLLASSFSRYQLLSMMAAVDDGITGACGAQELLQSLTDCAEEARISMGAPMDYQGPGTE